MATKTLSVDLVAYERLRRARCAPSESFSSVIKRAHWDESKRNCAALLRALESAAPVAAEVLGALDEAQRRDAPPEDPWSNR